MRCCYYAFDLLPRLTRCELDAVYETVHYSYAPST